MRARPGLYQWPSFVESSNWGASSWSSIRTQAPLMTFVPAPKAMRSVRCRFSAAAAAAAAALCALALVSWAAAAAVGSQVVDMRTAAVGACRSLPRPRSSLPSLAQSFLGCRLHSSPTAFSHDCRALAATDESPKAASTTSRQVPSAPKKAVHAMACRRGVATAVVTGKQLLLEERRGWDAAMIVVSLSNLPWETRNPWTDLVGARHAGGASGVG